MFEIDVWRSQRDIPLRHGRTGVRTVVANVGADHDEGDQPKDDTPQASSPLPKNDKGARSTDPFALYSCDRFMRTVAMGAIGFEPT